MTFTITGPGVRNVLWSVEGLWDPLVNDDTWGVAQRAVGLDDTNWVDVWEAGNQLAALLNTVPAAPVPTGRVTVNTPRKCGDHVTVTTDRATLRAAVDLWVRCRCGEFGRLAVDTGRGWELAGRIDRWRVSHQKRGTWPDHPGAHTGIREAPFSTQVAYDVWKLLGGGVPEWGTLGTGVTVEESA